MPDVTFEWTIKLGTQEKSYSRTKPAARAVQLLDAAYKQRATPEELEGRQPPGVDFDMDADMLDRLLWGAVKHEHDREGERMHGRDVIPMEP